MRQTYQKYIEKLSDKELKMQVEKYQEHVRFLEGRFEAAELNAAKNLLSQLEEEAFDRALLGDKS